MLEAMVGGKKRFCRQDAAGLAAIDAISRIGGAAAVEMLIQIEARERTRSRRLTIGIVAAVIVFVLVIVLVEVMGNGRSGGGISGFTNMFMFMGGGAAAASGLRRGAVNALNSLKDVRAAGSLAIAHQDAKLRPTCEQVLLQILPQVREEHLARFTDEERSAITKLLGASTSPIVSAALPVVGMYGEKEELVAVHTVAKRWPLLTDKAAECAQRIEGRLALKQDRAQLLRSSSEDAVDTDGLLRPASNLSDPNPEQLLREAPP